MGKNIWCFFSFLTEAIILWQYTSTLFAARRTAKKEPVILCGLYFILFFVSLFHSKLLNVALYFVFNFIFLITGYCMNTCSAFFHSSILTSVMILCEVMVYYIVRFFSPHFFERGENFHFLALFAIFSKLMFFTVIFILLHFLKGRQNHDERPDKSVFLLALIPITSVFVMVTFTKISDSCDLSPVLNWMLTLSAVFLLTINLLIFGIEQYNRKKSLEFMDMQLLLQKESDFAQYYEMLLSQHENQSILIHDIKKHLQSINTLNDKREHDKINLYIHELMRSSDLKEVSQLCNHETLNAILTRYGRNCLDQHISFHADIRSGVIDFIADADITSLFCNLLDNAIEAAEHIPDSFIEVSAYRREKTPFVVITVVNSSRKNPFDEQSGILSTTKANKYKHGFGIKSIRKIVSKYHGNMQMYYNQESLTFHTIITVKEFVR